MWWIPLTILTVLSCKNPQLLLPVEDTSEPGIPGVEEPEEPIEPGADEALVRALIAGEADVDEVFDTIAWSDGFPVHTTSDTWLFVTDNDRAWSLAGDMTDWDPLPMTKGDGFRWVEVEIVDPIGSTYKFTAADTWIADPRARAYAYDGFGEISLVQPSTSTWHLERWPDAALSGLAPRMVRVYVPAGSGPWPVLYMHDGQNLFDPGAIWGGWRMQDALAQAEPMLVVGIDNTADRFDEYTHVPDDIGLSAMVGGRADQYAALIDQVVRPHVNARYDTSGLNGVMGSSLGGLVSLYIAQEQPGRWDFAGSLSGTLGWGRFSASNPTMEELYLANGVQELVLYVDSGGGPGADNACLDPDNDGFPEDDPDSTDNYCENRQFVDALAGGGYTWGVDLNHWWEDGAPHNEAAWSARLDLPLDLFTALDD